MTEKKGEIDYSKDKQMVIYSDKLLGFNNLLSELAQEKGTLERQISDYVIEKYGITFETHIIDCLKLKLKER